MINNFFFVCFSEEVFFRGFIQRTLQNLLPKQQMLAVIITTLIFGAMHYRGGLTYIALSSIGGFFNGYTYYKTNRILCTRIVHFALNLFHILLFTYPALIKTI
ncbi:MAG TPA: CPBP family intramembrane metalloprotease [Rickettsia endosymbiont of Columbicola hoogstraali]|nr:CPBP family intramembrane metalloprotease [Rickettsia endosymbiont of Columbicola hoogstraali]